MRIHCKIFPSPYGLEPIFFYGTRVNLKHLIPDLTQEDEKTLIQETREDGEYLIVKSITPILEPGLSDYFCHVEDIGRIFKCIRQPGNGKPDELFVAKKNFIASCAETEKIEQTILAMQELQKSVFNLSDQQKRIVKRRRQDFAPVVDVLSQIDTDE